MRVRLLPIALVVLAFTILTALPTEARHRNRDRDRRFDNRSRIIVVNPQHRGFQHRPQGWDRGRKAGWRGCDLPPGLAKKYGCHSTFRHSHRRVQRRPVIVIPFLTIR